MSQETTCLLECTYWYVPVHTSTYDREILVLHCTVLYQYVLVRTSMYQFAQSCPGVQDSRCEISTFNLKFACCTVTQACSWSETTILRRVTRKVQLTRVSGVSLRCTDPPNGQMTKRLEWLEPLGSGRRANAAGGEAQQVTYQR